MEHEISPGAELGMPRRQRLLLLAAVSIIVAASGAFLAWRASPGKRVDPLEFRSPYQNTRLGVAYVGDAVCSRCHGEIAQSYRQHPMGRSLCNISDAASLGADPGIENSQFDVNGLSFSIERQGNRVIHQETRRDASGHTITQVQAEVQYVVGSGRQAFSYLIEHDGFLYESPITWYAKDKRWGLSPGYAARTSRFDRPILSECLFCHSNRVERVSGTINKYRTPVFTAGHAIGCERCHGPGELHVRRPTVIDGRDVTIVNPADLAPSLRDSVCEQCHLIGPRRIARLGTASEDFRPGLPFYRFWSVFVASSRSGQNKFASQAEQMHDSRCYLASSGQLGCISCHDPHVMPQTAEKAAYFRDRCLGCHADRGCRLPASARALRTGGDDCVGCHMPRSSSSNNTHVATTNHRIPRHASGESTPPGRTEPPVRAGPSLVNFHRDLMSVQERALTERDRGIALCRGGGRAAAEEALPLIEAAVAALPDDIPALDCKGELLGLLGRPEQGLAAYRLVLAKDPTRQTAIEGAAALSSQLGKHQDAVTYWQQAIAIDPRRSGYHTELAREELRLHHWRQAALASQTALRLNPSSLQVRKWLVQCYLHLGDPQSARREIQTILGFDPPDREELLRLLQTPVPSPSN
jgi:hypothetical protein